MRLKDIGEFGFIDRVKSGCVTRARDVIRGIGDDCCAFNISGDLAVLFTTDMLVEEVHFLREAIPAYQLGRKSLGVNISDIAAMGGNPKEAVVSIAVPTTIDVAYLDAFYDGMKSMAWEFEVNLLGGDTTSSPGNLVINVALVGEAHEEEILYRSGARSGDVIFLTGPVGSSAAGLDMLLSGRTFDGGHDLVDAHCDPYPQVKEGRIIAGLKVANSLIDVSDGVAADLHHICSGSNLGAVIEEQSIPTSERFQAYCRQFDQDPRHLSLHVGEDYVLLGTVPASSSYQLEEALKSNGCEFYPMGRMVAEPGLRLKGRDGSIETIAARGWNHFA